MHFVFDTNVLISAALFKDSVTDRALEKDRGIGKVLISDDTFAELKDVIYRSKFD